MDMEDMLDTPTVRAALARHGLTPDGVRSTRQWRVDETITRMGNGAGLPTLTLRKSGMWFNWLVGITSTEYQVSPTGPSGEVRQIMKIRNHGLPAALINGLAGGRLDGLLGLPGAESLTILEAKDSSRGQTEEVEMLLGAAA